MLDWPDWIWWTSAGGFGALAALSLYFSLFRDRARGRERCPKCWYDMAGSAPTPEPSAPRGEGARRCPECGYEAKRERAWLRTRRRWRWSVVGFALLALTIVSLLMPHYRRHGWAYYLPDRVLVWAYPRFDPPQPIRGTYNGRPILYEITMRLSDDEMSKGSRRGLVVALEPWLDADQPPSHRAEALDFLADLHPESRRLLDRLIDIRNAATGEPDTLALRVIAHYAWTDPRAEKVVNDLLQDLDPQNDDVFWLAQGLPTEGPYLDRTVAVLASLIEQRSANWGNVAFQLALIGPAASDALPVLRETAVESTQQGEHEWSASAAAIGVITGDAESFVEYESRLLSHNDLSVRSSGAMWMRNYSGYGGFTMETIENIREALLSENDEKVLRELISTAIIEPALAKPLKAELRQLARDSTQSADVREWAYYALDRVRYPNRRR